MWSKISAGWLLSLLAACGYVNKYEEAVYDMEPVYCYQSIGKATCYDKPSAVDGRRLVNYFGPHPSRYNVEQPEPFDASDLEAPPEIDVWVKDPEPVILTGDALRQRNLEKIIADKKYMRQIETVYDRKRSGLNTKKALRKTSRWVGPKPGTPEKITYQTLLDGTSEPARRLVVVPNNSTAAAVSDGVDVAPPLDSEVDLK